MIDPYIPFPPFPLVLTCPLVPRCEGSDQVRVGEALGALSRHAQPLEEVHLLANRITVLPPRLFGSLLVGGAARRACRSSNRTLSNTNSNIPLM